MNYEQDLIEYLEWLISTQSGGLGFPTNYDFKRGTSRSNVRNIPTPNDFPAHLRIIDKAYRLLTSKQKNALVAKYAMSGNDKAKAKFAGTRKDSYYKNLREATLVLKGAFGVKI